MHSVLGRRACISVLPYRGKQLQTKIMESAISGEGFFCLEFDEDEGEVQEGGLLQPNITIISAEPGKLSLHILEAELKHLFEGDWDWQIAQVGDNDFVVTFPTVSMPLAKL